jgi:RNA polymerase sigma factor (sigma-70 family)
MTVRADLLARRLNERREAFTAFLARRVGSTASTEDILQDGLLKAVRRADTLQDDTKLVAWFYQLLRHAIVDHHRADRTRRRKEDGLGALAARLGEDTTPPPKAWEAQICGCVGSVIDTLKPAHAELLRRVELDGQSVQDAARALRLTPNRASVTLHRARKELRARLEAFCGACANGACLDCDCAPVPAARRRV